MSVSERRARPQAVLFACGLNAVRSPFRTAERISVEEIVDPRDTRPLLCDWAARAHELVALEAGHGPVARGTRP